MTGLLADQVAVVTGAARGQGRSHALALAAEGASVIALDACAPIATVPYPLPAKEDLEDTAEQVRALGARVIHGVVDVRDLAGMERFVGDAVAELGRLDIVCANAGISTPSSTLEMTEEMADDHRHQPDRRLENLQATVPHIVAGNRGGSVIITSSAATAMISQNIAHYTAAKHGLIGFMRVLAKELAPHRIRVNTLHPTGVKTPMILNEPMYRLFRPDLADPGREDFEASARSHHALGVPAVEPEDVSAAVIYLAAPSGRYVTGTTFMLDAGGALA
jgi:(+)-trans-carveol dehydrogenase